MSVIDKVYLKNISGDRIRYDLGANAENINYDETDLKDKIDDTNNSIVQHDELQVSTEEGAHGLRYYAQCLQGYNTEEEDWEIIQEGGSSVDYPIGDVIGASVEVNGNSVTLRLSDPNDIIIGELVLAELAGTVLVRKVDSAPADVNDGTVLVTVTERNQYSSTGYIDNGLSYDTNYYYKFFPYKLKEDETRRYTSGTSLLVRPATEIIENIPSPAANVEYSGASQSPTLLNYNPVQLDISGQSTGVNVGTYTAFFTPKSGFTWSDGTTTARNVSLTIVAKQVSIPSVTNTSFNYNGLQQGPTVSSYDTSIISISGDKRIDAGNYTLILSLNNTTNYVLTDGTTSNKETALSISPITLALPTVTGSYTYNGSSKTVSISTSSTYVTISGTQTATNAGTYTIYVNLKSTVNTKLSDGTTTQKTLTLTIQKAEATITFTPASGVVITRKNPQSTIIASNVSGTISNVTISTSIIDIKEITSANKNVTIELSKNVEVSPDILFDDYLTFYINESTNYKSGQKKFNFKLKATALKPLSSAKDNEILTMIDDYYAGYISLDDVKSVLAIADTRQNQLESITNGDFGINSYSDEYSNQVLIPDYETYAIPNQETAQLTIIDFNHDTLSSSINGITKALVTIQMKGTIGSDANTAITGKMNPTTGAISHLLGGTKRRFICNTALYQALIFKNHVKAVRKYYATSSSKIDYINDYVFLLAAQEITGNESGIFTSEGTYYPYYNIYTTKRGGLAPTSGYGIAYLTRTSDFSSSTSMKYMDTDVTVKKGSIDSNYAISPAVCL